MDLPRLLLRAPCLFSYPLQKVEVVQQNCLDECPMGPNCGVPRADDPGAPRCGLHSMYSRW